MLVTMVKLRWRRKSSIHERSRTRFRAGLVINQVEVKIE